MHNNKILYIENPQKREIMPIIIKNLNKTPNSLIKYFISKNLDFDENENSFLKFLLKIGFSYKLRGYLVDIKLSEGNIKLMTSPNEEEEFEYNNNIGTLYNKIIHNTKEIRDVPHWEHEADALKYFLNKVGKLNLRIKKKS